MHSWARNIKNVVPQKPNAICKTRAQYAKRNCAFELFIAHCAATINAYNASFHKKNFKCKKRNRNLNNKILLSTANSYLRMIRTWALRFTRAGLNHCAIRVNLQK